jgi:hypothetical protein
MLEEETAKQLVVDVASGVGRKDIRTKLNIDDLFMLYASFCGDVERTAHAVGCKAVDVLRIADDERWNEKLKSIIELKKSERPGDVERAINRALNFVQAHRFRSLLDQLVLHFVDEARQKGIDQVCVVKTTNAKTEAVTVKIDTKPLSDLAAALEKVHWMTYVALNDSVADRKGRNETIQEAAGGELHAKIAQAMAEAASSTSPRAQLIRQQLENADRSRPGPV